MTHDGQAVSESQNLCAHGRDSKESDVQFWKLLSAHSFTCSTARTFSKRSPQRHFPLAVLPLLKTVFFPTAEAWDQSLLTWCTDRECSVLQPALMPLCSHCNTDCEQSQWLLRLTWVHPCLCWLSCSEILQSLNVRVVNITDVSGYLRKGIVTCDKPKIT